MTIAEDLARAYPDAEFTWQTPTRETLDTIQWHTERPADTQSILAAIDALPTRAEKDARTSPVDDLRLIIADIVEELPPTANKADLRTRITAVRSTRPDRPDRPPKRPRP